MLEQDLITLLLHQLEDHQPRSVPELVESALKVNKQLYESDIKGVLLGLVRRNRLDVTNDFKVRLPDSEPILQRG